MTVTEQPTPRLTGTKCAVFTCTVFALAEMSRRVLFSSEAYSNAVDTLPRALEYAEQPLRWTLLIFLALWIGQRINPIRAIDELGMWANIGLGFAMAFVATLPMLIVPIVFGSINPDIDPLWLLFSALFWPLAEEILFRGFLFRQLYRWARWGFWPAALASSLIFGVVHLTNAVIQRQPVFEQFGAIAMIAVLSVLGAWVFIRWDENLWVMVGLHGFMNLWWGAFALGETALGSTLGNVARLAAVVLIILFTVYRERIEAWLRGKLGRGAA